MEPRFSAAFGMILNSTISLSSRLLHMRWSAIVRSTWRRDSTTTLPNPSWTWIYCFQQFNAGRLVRDLLARLIWAGNRFEARRVGVSGLATLTRIFHLGFALAGWRIAAPASPKRTDNMLKNSQISWKRA